MTRLYSLTRAGDAVRACFSSLVPAEPLTGAAYLVAVRTSRQTTFDRGSETEQLLSRSLPYRMTDMGPSTMTPGWVPVAAQGRR